MLTKSKKNKLSNALKEYHQKYLGRKLTDLDESGTRLMVNSFLTDVLGYLSIEEVKTEYMIKGTYADYVVQLKGVRHFLVEVKALPLELSDKHLRQAVNYGANEGIEWAILTNGKNFDLYRILFNKPIEARKIFSVDFGEKGELKNIVESLQFLHRDAVADKALDLLWNKHIALDPMNIAGLLCAPPVVNFVKRTLKKKFKNKFSDIEVITSIKRVIHDLIQLDDIKSAKLRKGKKKKKTRIDKTIEKIKTETIQTTQV